MTSESSLNNKMLKRLALYVHFSPNGLLSSVDQVYLRALSDFGMDIIFISNGQLVDGSLDKAKELSAKFIQRENKGYDFGAWKDALLSLGRDEIAAYDQLILCNNSVVGPIVPLDELFGEMKLKGSDFWGITLFPYHPDIKILDENDTSDRYIPEHLQSYFIVFENDVFTSDAFWDFWQSYKESDDYLQTILNGEIGFTEYLSNSGFSYGAYFPESLTIGQKYNTNQPQNELGLEYARLGVPFIKKKNKQFMPDEKKYALIEFLEGQDCRNEIAEFFYLGKDRFKYFYSCKEPKIPNLVSIVIPTKNAGPNFRKVLEAVFTQKADFPYEVICIDSGSSDDTLNIISEFNVRLIQIPSEEFGHGKTRNLGAREANGEYVVFITQDAQPASDDWLQNLVLPMMCDDTIVGCFGRHLPYPDCNVFDKRDIEGLFYHFSAFDALAYIDDRERWEIKDSYMQLLCFFSDNNSCVRKSKFLQNPYPDVQFAEDQIWMRARLEEGNKKAYCDDAAVYHSHNYKGKELLQRYFDDYKGMQSIHGYTIVDRKKNIPKEFIKSLKSDISFIRSIPIARGKKIPLVFEAISRNSKKYTAGYLGGVYHLQNANRQNWLDKHFSQQKRKKEE